jgi:hypothetical protein
MGPEWAERYGYSWVLLRRGVDAWPWRQVSPAQSETGCAARVPQPFSESEPGASRGVIEDALRQRRARNDLGLDRETSVA